MNRETVEIVDQEGQSLASGISGALGEGRSFGRYKMPEILVQEKARDERSMECLFEDEPRSVTFIRVNDENYSKGGRIGVKRMVIDHAGTVRTQLEV